MNLDLPDNIKELKQNTRRFVDEVLIPLETELDKVGEFTPRILNALQHLRVMGYYGLTIPEEYGGKNLGELACAVVSEELCRSHSAFQWEFGAAVGIGSRSLLNAGNETQKRTYLPRIASGELITAFALTEAEAGSDAQNIKTIAVKDGNEWVLNGTKLYISNAKTAGLFTVLAVTDHKKRGRGGITAFLVEKSNPGLNVVRILETMGSKPYVHGEIVFDNCRVPQENVLGNIGEGFNLALNTLDTARLQAASAACGAAQRLVEMSLAWSKKRIAFGKSIANHQFIQGMLADSGTELYAARRMIYDTAWRIDCGEKVPMEAAMCKLFATEMVGRVADRAVQIHGGMGYLRELPVERIYRDVRGMRIYEGTSEIQRIVIALMMLEFGFE